MTEADEVAAAITDAPKTFSDRLPRTRDEAIVVVRNEFPDASEDEINHLAAQLLMANGGE